MTELARPKAPKHNRMKPRRFESKQHCDFVAARGCLICRRPAEIHHVKRPGEKRHDYSIIPLCPLHHRGTEESQRLRVSIHALGNDGFYKTHRVDPFVAAKLLAEKSPDPRVRELVREM